MQAEELAAILQIETQSRRRISAKRIFRLPLYLGPYAYTE